MNKSKVSPDKIDDELYAVRTGRVIGTREDGSYLVRSGRSKIIQVKECPLWIKENDRILYELTEIQEDETTDIGIFASDIEHGKVIHKNRLGNCIVKPEQNDKLVKVKKCFPWIIKKDRIPYMLTHIRDEQDVDWGLFFDKTIGGSIVVIGYSPSDYERSKDLPEGLFFNVIGFGNLFNKVHDKFYERGGLNRSSPEDYVSLPLDYKGFNFILGHNTTPNFLKENLSDLLKKHHNNYGTDIKDNYFIDVKAIKTNERWVKVSNNLKKKFTKSVFGILKEHLLS